MRKNLLLILFCAIYLFSYAQKESKELLLLQVAIAPQKPQPEKPVKYLSIVDTKANVSPTKVDAWKKEDLVISGPKYSVASGSPDWTITLKTSDIKITSRNEKPATELSDNDWLAKFIYEASITITDASNTVVYQADLPESGKEQEFKKGIIWVDPTYKVRLGMAKNNPAKTKAIVDEILASNDDVILSGIIEKAGNQLNDVFGDQQKSINQSLFGVKGKAYEEINTVNEKIIAVYGKFRALSKKNRVPKEEMDNVLREAIPVWEKFIANNKELEEKALKGLLLNCAFASTWLGDYAKASEYLAKVPEAKEVTSIAGDATLLSFDQSAENAFYFNKLMQDYKGRTTLVQ